MALFSPEFGVCAQGFFELAAVDRSGFWAKRDRAIALLQSWIDQGDEAEQTETLDYLIQVLDEDRTRPVRKFLILAV
jgi:hypothetical protein